MSGYLENLIALVLALKGTPQERAQAEKEYVEQRATNPAGMIQGLCEVLTNSQHALILMFAVISIRQIAMSLNSDMDLWSQVPLELRASTRGLLLEMLNAPTTDRMVRRQLADAIAALAKQFTDSDNSELIAYAFQGCTNESTDIQVANYQLVARLAEYQVLDNVINTDIDIVSILLNGVHSSNPDVVKAAFSAICDIVAAMKTEVLIECAPLASWAPALVQTLTQAFNEADERYIEDLLAKLDSVALNNAVFFTSAIGDIVEVLKSVCESSQFSLVLRTGALQLLTGLGCGSRTLVRQVGKYPEYVLEAAFSLFGVYNEIIESAEGQERYLEKWTAEGNGSDESEVLDSIDSAISGLVKTIGSRTAWSRILPLMQQYLRSDNWVEQLAGLAGINALIAAATQVAEKHTTAMVETVLPFLQHPTEVHPCVLMGCLDTLMRLAKTVRPVFLAKTIKTVLLTINGLLQPEAVNHRVIMYGESIFCILLQECEVSDTVMKQILPAALPSLNLVINSGDLLIQNPAFLLLGSLAAASGKLFVDYYRDTIPVVLEAIESTQNSPSLSPTDEETFNQMRAHMISCVGKIATAVGFEVFAEEAEHMIQVLLHFTRSDDGIPYEIADSAHRALFLMCQSMGSAFAPTLRHVIPALIRAAAYDDAVIKCEVDEEGVILTNNDKADKCNEDDGYVSYDFPRPGGGITRHYIHVAHLTEKVTATGLLGEYAVEIRDAFGPYAEHTLEVIWPLCDYESNDTIRENAIRAIPALLDSAKQYYLSKTNGDEESAADLLRIQWEKALATLLAPLKKRQPHSRRSVNMLFESLGACLNVLPFPASDKHVSLISTLLEQLFTHILTARKIRSSQEPGEDEDPEDEEAKGDELEQAEADDATFFDTLTSLAKELMDNSIDCFMAEFQSTLWPTFSEFLKESSPLAMMESALILLGDIIAKNHPISREYFPIVLELAVAWTTSTELPWRRRRVGAYVLAMGIKVHGGELQEHVPRFIELLVDFVSQEYRPLTEDEKDDEEEARSDHEAAVDNALSAIMWILKYSIFPEEGETPIALAVEVQAKLAECWISKLPRSVDEIEARSQHGMLLRMASQMVPLIVGENNSNMPLIFDIFSQVIQLAQGSEDFEALEVVEPHDALGMKQLWANFCESIPESLRESVLGQIPEHVFQVLSDETEAE